MECKIINSIDELYKLEQSWESLQELDDDATIYSTYRFARAWCEAYEGDKDKELFVICVFNGKEIIGIAPLIIQHHRKSIFSFREIAFLGRGDFFTVLVDSTSKDTFSIFKKIFSCIDENKCKWEKMNLINIRSDSHLGRFFLKSRKYNRHFSDFQKYFERPRLVIGKYGSFEKYENIMVSRYIKNTARKLKDNTDYELEVCMDNNTYDIVSRIHIDEQEYLREKRNRSERVSLFNDERCSAFIRNIYEGEKNIVTFLLKSNRHDGRYIAYESCYIYKGVLHMWNSAYDAEFESLSVGSVLSLELVKYCFENKIATELDFGGGRYPWKFDLADSFTATYQLELWNEDTREGRRMKRLSEIRTGMHYILGKNS